MRQVLRVAWYRLRATFRSRVGGLLVVVVLVGLIGGVAMGATAAARRTQSSFAEYLRSTNPFDVRGPIATLRSGKGSSGYDADAVAAIARLPRVKRVATFTVFNPEIVAWNVPGATNGDGIEADHRHEPAGQQPATLAATTGGEFSTMDRPFVVSGRLADPRRLDEVVVSEHEASVAKIRVGSVIPIGVFTNDQAGAPDCCDRTNKPYRRVDLKVVGVVVFNDAVVQDDVDALGSDLVLFTPAFDRAFRDCCAYFTGALLQLRNGRRDVAAFTNEVGDLRSRFRSVGQFSDDKPQALTKAERAIKPEAIALGVFGAVAALAAFLIGAQAIGRQVRLGEDDDGILRAIGAGPAMTASDGLVGVLGALVVGALLAVGIAVALSPLSPLGPARPVYPHRGIAWDWTVLGLGLGALIGPLGAIAIVMSYLQTPHRRARRSASTTRRPARLARIAASSGLPAPAATGIRFALDPGVGATAVPVRSAIIGAVAAIGVVTATVTFGASLSTLVSHPSLYGWNWDYELLGQYGGQEDLPEAQTASLLAHDQYVAASAGVSFGALRIDGHPVAVIGEVPNADVAPPVLTGHGLQGPGQIVLGTNTMADLHKHLGDTVVVSSQKSSVRLRIVGTATMPTIGTSGNLHPTMGTGAVLSALVIPANQRNSQQSPIPGPNAVLIRLRAGVDRSAASRSLQRINSTLGAAPDGAGGVTSVLHPAEIVDYRSQQNIPAYLGAMLAGGAVLALGFTLIASVQRRRRDLALLRMLGFTRGQLGSVVAWQSLVAVGIGVVVGVPLGIGAGRALWDLFARAIDAVPRPVVPTLTVALVVIGALALASVAAAIPARHAARTRTAALLQAD